jgi:hypothetical protein
MFLCTFQFYVKLGFYPCVALGTIYIFYKYLVFHETLLGERGSDPFCVVRGGWRQMWSGVGRSRWAERGGVNGYTYVCLV